MGRTGTREFNTTYFFWIEEAYGWRGDNYLLTWVSFNRREVTEC